MPIRPFRDTETQHSYFWLPPGTGRKRITYAVRPVVIVGNGQLVFTAANVSSSFASTVISSLGQMIFSATGSALFASASISGSGYGTDVMWEVDFTSYPLSTTTNSGTLSGLLTTNGLAFTRNSPATVQTSTSSIVTSGINANIPRIGNAGYGQGLVMEEPRTALLSYTKPASTGDSLASILTSSVAGPDDTTAYSMRLEDAEMGVISYVAKPTPAYTPGAWYVGSYWYRDVSGTLNSLIGFNMNDALLAPPGAGVRGLDASSSWTRKSHVYQGAASGVPSSYVPIPAYTANSVGVADFALLDKQEGKFATEHIITTGSQSTRSGDVLYGSSSNVVFDGRVGLEFEIIPKAAPAEYTRVSDYTYLWSMWDSDNTSIVMRPSTGKIEVWISGSSYVTPTGVSWTAGQSVKIWIEAGGGQNTRVVYKVGSAARIVLGESSSPQSNVPITHSRCFFMCYGSNYELSSWVQKIRTYAPQARPSWTV